MSRMSSRLTNFVTCLAFIVIFRHAESTPASQTNGNNIFKLIFLDILVVVLWALRNLSFVSCFRDCLPTIYTLYCLAFLYESNYKFCAKICTLFLSRRIAKAALQIIREVVFSSSSWDLHCCCVLPAACVAAITRIRNNCLILISPVLTHLVLWVALRPSVSSTYHSHHPTPLHSFIPDLKPPFSANAFHRCLPFLLQDWLHGFPGLFTDTSEHIHFFCLVFLFSHFFVVGSVRKTKLTFQFSDTR